MLALGVVGDAFSIGDALKSEGVTVVLLLLLGLALVKILWGRMQTCLDEHFTRIGHIDNLSDKIDLIADSMKNHCSGGCDYHAGVLQGMTAVKDEISDLREETREQLREIVEETRNAYGELLSLTRVVIERNGSIVSGPVTNGRSKGPGPK